MTHNHDSYHEPETRAAWWKTSSGITAIFFFLAGGYFLVKEHSAHIVPYLPWLILLLCPLMHLFHHGGHSDHNRGHNNETVEKPDKET